MIAATPKAPTVFLPAAFWFLAGVVGEVVAEEPELVAAGLPVPGVVVAPLGVELDHAYTVSLASKLRTTFNTHVAPPVAVLPLPSSVTAVLRHLRPSKSIGTRRKEIKLTWYQCCC